MIVTREAIIIEESVLFLRSGMKSNNSLLSEYFDSRLVLISYWLTRFPFSMFSARINACAYVSGSNKYVIMQPSHLFE